MSTDSSMSEPTDPAPAVPLSGEVVGAAGSALDVPIAGLKAVRDDLLPPQDVRTASQQAHIDNGKNLLIAGAGLLAAGAVAIAVGGAL